MSNVGQQRNWHVAVTLWLLSCVSLSFLTLAFAFGKWAYDLALDFMSAASLSNYTMRSDTAFLWDHLADRFVQEWGQKRVLAQFALEWQWLKYFLMFLLPAFMLGVRHLHLRSVRSTVLLRMRNRTMLAVGAKVSAAICLLFCVAVAGGVIAMVSIHALFATIFLVRPAELAAGFAILLWFAPNRWLLGSHKREKDQSPRPLTNETLSAFWKKFIAPIFDNTSQLRANLMGTLGQMRKLAPSFFLDLALWSMLYILLSIGRAFDYWASGVTLGMIEPGTVRTAPQAPLQLDYMSIFWHAFILPSITTSFMLAFTIALVCAVWKYRIQQSCGAYAMIGIKLSVWLQWLRNALYAAIIIMLLFQVYNALLAFTFKYSLPHIAIPLFVAMLFAGWHLLNRLCPSIGQPESN